MESAKIVTTKPFVGICRMQVCAEEDTSDEEILRHCNIKHPSGTKHGWVEVKRSGEEEAPVVCKENPQRMHFIVVC